jgi:hypothetical protein
MASRSGVRETLTLVQLGARRDAALDEQGAKPCGDLIVQAQTRNFDDLGHGVLLAPFCMQNTK